MNKLGDEYVFGTYIEDKNNGEDSIFVKVHEHYENGEIKPRLRQIKNFKREVYVTKPEFRDHEDKKEFEYKTKCRKILTTEREMPSKLWKELNGFAPKNNITYYQVKDNPYIYGCDTPITSVLAEAFIEKNPKLVAPLTLAVMDYEWDVKDGTGEILCGVISMKKVVHLAVRRSFLKNVQGDLEQRIKDISNEYLGEVYKERGIKLKIDIVEDEHEVPLKLIDTAHQLKPDVLGFWSIAGDMNKMLNSFNKVGIDPANVFSDPSVPKAYRFFNWYEDKTRKLKSNGDVHIKHHTDLLHVVTTPASFHMQCLMALYKTIRAAKQLKSFSLDNILHEELSLGKLKFKHLGKMLEKLSQLSWHKIMQERFPLEYLVYLQWDAIPVEMLNELTGDVSWGLRTLANKSSFKNIKSTPTILRDCQHFNFLKDGKVIGVASKDMMTPMEKLVPDRNDWIKTLPTELRTGMGVKCILEDETVETLISIDNQDLDVESAYPTLTINLNISKFTRKYEVCKIQGFNRYKQRRFTISLTNVKGNAIQLAQDGWGFPLLNDLYDDFVNSF